jgi:hypothetical protein
MDEADRHTDAACSQNEAKSPKSFPQMVSNCHGPASLPSNFNSVERMIPLVAARPPSDRDPKLPVGGVRFQALVPRSLERLLEPVSNGRIQKYHVQ